MRTRFTIALLAICTIATAQEKYSVVLNRTRTLSPYEAIYQLMDYQQLVPQQANIYYQLGNRTYELLPSRNALYHYREYSELLYHANLFYSNCLFFAKDKKQLPKWQYAEIANGDKKVEYSALEAYLRPRLEEVVRRKIACDSIHNSFYRLVEQYNSCQKLFTSFLTLYTREKTAHLQLSSAQRAELEKLASKAALLEPLIQAYLHALDLEPLEGYNPQFRWVPIELYRLDGLTATDFLQNDVALWDYTRWVDHFLREQTDTYEKLYADVDKEYNSLTRILNDYRSGKTIPDLRDETLTGRCRRLELNTPRVQVIGSMQALAQLGIAEQHLAQIENCADLQEIVPLLQLVSRTETHRQNVTEPMFIPVADSAINLMHAHIIRLAQQLDTLQQPDHTSPVTGEVTSYTPLTEERVHALLPTSHGWRTALVNEQTHEVQVLDLNPSMEEAKLLLQISDEQPLLLLNMPDNHWALITDQQIYRDDFVIRKLQK